MKKPKSILPRLAVLEGNLGVELQRLARLRSQGKLLSYDGPKIKHGRSHCRHTMRQKIDYFRSHIRISSNGCWEWTGPLSVTGYGCICVTGRVVRAHRFSFVIFHRREPRKNICHVCDNCACVNPAHFFEGTQKENMRDCASKGRTYSPFGERHPHAKLTEAQVFKIRASTLPVRVLAKKWRVCVTSIRNVLRGDTWSHLPFPTNGSP